jgi:hypothetical protein
MNPLDLSHPTYNLLFYMQMLLDQSWMYVSRLCNDYIKGLDAFIDFTKKDMLDNVRENLCCSCKHCKNEKKYCPDDVLRSHLIKHGFMEDYRCWNKYGDQGLNEPKISDSYLEREVSTAVEEE